MGLDQYLSATKYTSKYQDEEFNKMLWKLFPDMKPCNMSTISVDVEVGYWRKANAIHKWFVDKVQDGDDDCKTYDVSRGDLEDLQILCVLALEFKDKDDKSDLKDILPTTSGFFFGGTEYDEWYFENLEETIEIVKKCLKLPVEWDFEYHSSW